MNLLPPTFNFIIPDVHLFVIKESLSLSPLWYLVVTTTLCSCFFLVYFNDSESAPTSKEEEEEEEEEEEIIYSIMFNIFMTINFMIHDSSFPTNLLVRTFFFFFFLNVYSFNEN